MHDDDNPGVWAFMLTNAFVQPDTHDPLDYDNFDPAEPWQPFDDDMTLDMVNIINLLSR